MQTIIRSLFGSSNNNNNNSEDVVNVSAIVSSPMSGSRVPPLATPRTRQGAPRTPPTTAHELDLTTVHAQLMVVGRPWDLPTNKKEHKNNIDQIVSFLEKRYSSHYLVFNLSNFTYDYYKFSYQVLDQLVGNRSKENDVIQTPTLEELFSVCYAMQFWMGIHPENVVVLHCRNGIRRTRLVVAASLLFDGTCTTPDYALLTFYQKRLSNPNMTHEDLPRLIPSARELLDSFRAVVEEGCVPNPEPLILNTIVIMGLPTDFEDQPEPVVELYRGNRLLFSNRTDKGSVIQWNAARGELTLKSGVEVFHDMLLVCRGLLDLGAKREPEERIMFQYSFHTGFLAPGALRLKRDRVDIPKKRKRDYGVDFMMDLMFVEKTKRSSSSSSHTSQHAVSLEDDTRTPPRRRDITRIQLGLRGGNARFAGMSTVTTKHTLPPDPTVMQHLLEAHPDHEATLVSFACQRTLNDHKRAVELIRDFDDVLMSDDNATSTMTSTMTKSAFGGIHGMAPLSPTSAGNGNGSASQLTRTVSPPRSSSSPHFNNHPGSLSTTSPSSTTRHRYNSSLILPSPTDVDQYETSKRSEDGDGDESLQGCPSSPTAIIPSAQQHRQQLSKEWQSLFQPFVAAGWNPSAPFVFLMFEKAKDRQSVHYTLVRGDGISKRVAVQQHHSYVYTYESKHAWDVVIDPRDTEMMPPWKEKKGGEETSTKMQWIAMMRTESQHKQYRYLSFQCAPNVKRHYHRGLSADERRAIRYSTAYEPPPISVNFVVDTQFLFLDRQQGYVYMPTSEKSKNLKPMVCPAKHKVHLRRIKDGAGVPLDVKLDHGVLDKLSPRMVEGMMTDIDVQNEEKRRKSLERGTGGGPGARGSEYSIQVLGENKNEGGGRKPATPRNSTVTESLEEMYGIDGNGGDVGGGKVQNDRSDGGSSSVGAIPRSVLLGRGTEQHHQHVSSGIVANIHDSIGGHVYFRGSGGDSGSGGGSGGGSGYGGSGGSGGSGSGGAGLVGGGGSGNDLGGIYFQSDEAAAAAGFFVRGQEMMGGSGGSGGSGDGDGGGGSGAIIHDFGGSSNRIGNSRSNTIAAGIIGLESSNVFGNENGGKTVRVHSGMTFGYGSHGSGQSGIIEGPMVQPPPPTVSEGLLSLPSDAPSSRSILDLHRLTYEMMLKAGVPLDAIEMKMKTDGISDSHTKDFLMTITIKAKQEKEAEANSKTTTTTKPLNEETNKDNVGSVDGLAIQDDPKYQPYLKMLKMGIPPPAVKQKMMKDGVDPSILDMDRTKPPLTKTKHSKRTQAGAKKKKNRRRTKKLRWDAIDEGRLDGKDTIWGDLGNDDNEGDDDLDMEEMTSLFVAAANSPTSSGRRKRRLGTKNNSEGKSNERVSLIDPKRSRNVAISLARFKNSYEDIRDGLFRMALPDLTTEQLLVMETVLPSPTEMRQVRGYRGDVSRLLDAERFFTVVSDVQNLQERLGCMLCVRQFPGNIKELMGRIDIVQSTCEDIKTSNLLRKILEIALKIGNQLNQLEEDGNVSGIRAFSLRSLVKLSQTKSFDKKTTVLHVIARYATKKKEAAMESSGGGIEGIKAAGETKSQQIVEDDILCTNISEQIPTLEVACRIPLSVLETESKALRRSLQLVLKQLKNAPIMDPIWGPIRQFAASARLQSEVVDRMLDSCKQKYAQLVEFFAEDEDLKNDEFFQSLANFAVSFRKAVGDNKKMEELERRKRRLEQEQAQKRERRRSSIKQQGGSSAAPQILKSKSAPQAKITKMNSPPRNIFGRKITPREELLLAIAKKKGE